MKGELFVDVAPLGRSAIELGELVDLRRLVGRLVQVKQLRVLAASGRSGMRPPQFALLASFGGSAMKGEFALLASFGGSAMKGEFV